MTSKATIADLYRQVTRAAMLSLILNLGLGLVKLIGGIIGNSFALIADAVNSLGDVVATIVVLVGLQIAQRPADQEHPYGHSRAEGIAATNVAVLIIVSAVMITWEAVQRLGLIHDVPPIWALWIAGANIVIKESLYWYNRSVGIRAGSASIIANAWDHRSDAMCAAAVLVGLLVIRVGGTDYAWADEVAALIVAAAIAVSGVQLFRQSASSLMDIQASSAMVEKMREAALNIPDVKDVETLWVRKSGLEYFVDIHIEVPAELTVEHGHQIGHRVKARLIEQFTGVRDVLVHLEPHPHIPHNPN